MDLYSRFRRSLSRPKKTTTRPSDGDAQRQEQEEEEEETMFGITEPLIDFIKTFAIDTFKNFPVPDEERGDCGEETGASAGNVRKDLSEWQERHATLVLSKSKEMSQLRFKLCPRHLKEWMFWRIYFTLVKNYIAEYELRAIQLAKLRQMTAENEKCPDTSGYEVEMSETKQKPNLQCPLQNTT
ncbi:uncharacterized protein LOC127787267 [Diospyros lotus]|uniref:uncharacterized protein LOC127787267 n=1 Tax=Diospyros lotus TaxID=55363 RepID=UPI00225BE9F9|nr:uncharacterized protein LOC127787267 [Diospyros lotus]XP_052171190.1 uncharacterized protein LOC127787267 [Diospyros lotus]